MNYKTSTINILYAEIPAHTHAQTLLKKQTVRAWRNILIKYLRFVEFILIFILQQLWTVLNKLFYIIFSLFPSGSFEFHLWYGVYRYVNYDSCVRLAQPHWYFVCVSVASNEPENVEYIKTHIMHARIDQQERSTQKCIPTHENGNGKKRKQFTFFRVLPLWSGVALPKLFILFHSEVCTIQLGSFSMFRITPHRHCHICW